MTMMETDEIYNEAFAPHLRAGTEGIAWAFREDRKCPDRKSDLATPENMSASLPPEPAYNVPKL
jgi:hypothetical protein